MPNPKWDDYTYRYTSKDGGSEMIDINLNYLRVQKKLRCKYTSEL